MTYLIKTRTALAAAVAVVALAAVMLLPAGAVAQDNCTPTDKQYNKPTNVLCEEDDTIEAGGEAGDEAVAAGGGGGELPFTGFDAISLLAIAVALTGVGFTLRRLAGNGGEQG
jgi:hypothetical protein